MNKKFIVIVLGLAAVGLLIYSTSSSKKSSGTASSLASNHVMGDNKAGVTLIEYGDYECPACGAYYPIVKEVVTTYKTDILFQFRNFPLDQIHQNARAGARAAEAAAKQNKFWEMHDKLYETQKDWSQSGSVTTYFEQLASQIGLDINTYKNDYISASVNNLINADVKEAQKLGASGTPTFELNGSKLSQNPQSLDDFKKLIADAIKAKGVTPTETPTTSATTTTSPSTALPAQTPAQ
jgi:protein-disulfide isomerase